MTGYTVHTGSTEKFSNGWDVIFTKTTQKKAAKKAGTKTAKKPKKKKKS